MCGRIALINPDKETIKKRFKLSKVPKELNPQYNIAPSANIPTILNIFPDEINMVRWGLIPHWAKEENTKYSMINARAESIREKPAYRGPIKKQRCLILADTFYEWKKVGAVKKPYRFMKEDGSVFAFAGIWDCWKSGDKQIETCAIITKEADKFMKPIHDRMPVILDEHDEQKWLQDITIDDVMSIIDHAKNTSMKQYEISKIVNSPSNNTEEILVPIQGDLVF